MNIYYVIKSLDKVTSEDYYIKTYRHKINLFYLFVHKDKF